MRVFALKTSPISLKGLEVFIIIFGALIGVTALYVGVNYPSSNAVAQQQSGPYRLTLMEIMDTAWNSSMAQPQFFMMGTNGLQPSGNIQLPVHTLIQLTIISYDTATADSSDAEGKVTYRWEHGIHHQWHICDGNRCQSALGAKRNLGAGRYACSHLHYSAVRR